MVLLKQTRIKIIESESLKELEKKTNIFCEDKKIIDIKFYPSTLSLNKIIIIYNG